MAPAHSLFLSIALPSKDAMTKVRGPLPSPPPDKYEPHEIALPLSPPQRLMTTQPLPCPDGDVLPTTDTITAPIDSLFAFQDVLPVKQHQPPRMQLLPSPPYDDDTPLPTQSPVLPPPSTSPPHTSPPLARHKLSPLPSVALPPSSPTAEEAPMPDEPSIPTPPPTYTLPQHFVQEKAALTRLLHAAQEQDRRGKARDMELNARLTWISERMKACHAAERERLAEQAKAPASSTSCPTRSTTASSSMLFGCDAPLDPAAVYAQEVSSLKREETQVKLNKSEERKKRKLAQERAREVQSFLAAREADEALMSGATTAELEADEDHHEVPTMGGLGIFTAPTLSSRKKNGPVPIRFLVPTMLMRRKKEAGSRPLGTRCRDKAALARVRRGSSPLGRLLPGVTFAPDTLAAGKAPTAASDEADQMLDGADGEGLADDEELLEGEDEEVEAMDRLLGYGLALSSGASRTTSTSSTTRALPAIRIPMLLNSDPGATCFPLPISPLSPPSPSTELPMTSSMFCAVRVMPSKLSVSSLSSSPPSPVAASIAPSTPTLRSSFDDSSGSDSDTEEGEDDGKDVEDLGFELAFDEPEAEKEGREEGWVDVDLHAPSSTFVGAISPPASPARPFMALPGTAASLSPPPSPRRRFPLLRMSVAPSSPKRQSSPLSPDQSRGRSLHKTPSTTKIEKIDRRGGGAFVGGTARRVVYGGSWMDPSSYGFGRSTPSNLRGGERYAIGGDMLMVGVLGVGADECGGGSM